ncbi:MAG: hypothetical protein FJ257_02955 [Phycisphaerae bacterium]|nr:hypothetical protein [Phycisphaerae bacterium]
MTGPLRPLRTLLLTALLGAVAGAVLWTVYLDRERRLREEIAALESRMAEEIARREAMIERLSRGQRRAVIEVLAQNPALAAGPGGEVGVVTDLRFVELDEEGRELGRREYSIPGDVLFVDVWTARFAAESVAAGDPLRGSTIVLLRRIYSDRMPPADGLPIDTPGGIPDGYALAERSRFEQSVWRSFWRLASDPAAAEAQGVRVAQGEAVYKKVRPGDAYELVVEAAGGMTLVPRRAGAAEPAAP